MSNSGTTTSFLAVFIRLPNPLCADCTSPVLLGRGAIPALPRDSPSAFPFVPFVPLECPFMTSLRGGDGPRVGGNEGSSMSMIIEDRRKRVIFLRIVGDGGGRLRDDEASRVGDVDESKPFARSCKRNSKGSAMSRGTGATAMMGRSNDHDRTRSNARTWQPILHNTRAIWCTKLNSVCPEISLVPFTVWRDLALSWPNSTARLGSS